jgi:hypothetical protein
MSVIPRSYRGGVRQAGVSGFNRVLTRGNFGDLKTPIGKLRPVDPKLLRNLQMPISRPAHWGRLEHLLIGQFMYALASDVKEILTAVMSDAKSGPHGISVAAVSGLTKAMRARNRNGGPLREWGLLLKAMDVTINRVGDNYNLGVSFNKVKEKSGSRKKTIHGNKVAKLIERGFTITVTEKMKKYFQWRSMKLNELANTAAGGKNNAKNFAPAMSDRGGAFSHLSKLKVGSTTVVKGRPFVRPSLKAGAEVWRKRYWQSGVASKLFTHAWMRGHVRVPQATRGL